MKTEIPKGWRLLRNGSEIRKGDKFISLDGTVEKADAQIGWLVSRPDNTPVLETYIRKIQPTKRKK